MAGILSIFTKNSLHLAFYQPCLNTHTYVQLTKEQLNHKKVFTVSKSATDNSFGPILSQKRSPEVDEAAPGSALAEQACVADDQNMNRNLFVPEQLMWHEQHSRSG